MQIVQWIIAAGTTIFVAAVAYFQWRTAQQKAVLDLFERRHAIYEIVRKAVGTMISSSLAFDQKQETEFLEAKERAYFFFGDDVGDYLTKLWDDILDVRTADAESRDEQNSAARGEMAAKRRAALTRITQFYSTGQPLFAKYMRFSQTIPMNLRRLFDYAKRACKRIVQLLGIRL
jgi:hypothetical protein